MALSSWAGLRTSKVESPVERISSRRGQYEILFGTDMRLSVWDVFVTNNNKASSSLLYLQCSRQRFERLLNKDNDDHIRNPVNLNVQRTATTFPQRDMQSHNVRLD